ncbi:MAG: response regulator [Pyrinomonadaceae bacterium]
MPFVLNNQLNHQPKSQPLVLIVENHEDTRLMLKQILGIWGCRSIEVEYGEGAVGVAERARPDLILMNVGFPHFDGIEATRHIRQTPALKEVPIIILSSYAEPTFCQTALAAGGNDYLIKPIELLQLETLVVKHLDRFANRNNIVVGKFSSADSVLPPDSREV